MALYEKLPYKEDINEDDKCSQLIFKELYTVSQLKKGENMSNILDMMNCFQVITW